MLFDIQLDLSAKSRIQLSSSSKLFNTCQWLNWMRQIYHPPSFPLRFQAHVNRVYHTQRRLFLNLVTSLTLKPSRGKSIKAESCDMRFWFKRERAFCGWQAEWIINVACTRLRFEYCSSSPFPSSLMSANPSGLDILSMNRAQDRHFESCPRFSSGGKEICLIDKFEKDSIHSLSQMVLTN